MRIHVTLRHIGVNYIKVRNGVRKALKGTWVLNFTISRDDRPNTPQDPAVLVNGEGVDQNDDEYLSMVTTAIRLSLQNRFAGQAPPVISQLIDPGHFT